MAAEKNKPIDTATLQRAGGGMSAPSAASGVPGGYGVKLPIEGANMEMIGGTFDQAFSSIGGNDNLMDHINAMENTILPLKGFNALQGLQEAKLGVGDTSLHGLGSHVNIKGPIVTIHSADHEGH